jgi:hypothetical protein
MGEKKHQTGDQVQTQSMDEKFDSCRIDKQPAAK